MGVLQFLKLLVVVALSVTILTGVGLMFKSLDDDFEAELHSKDIYSRLSKLSEQNKRKSEEKLEDVDGQNKPETAVKESYFSKTGFITERKNNGTTPPRQPSVVLKGLEKHVKSTPSVHIFYYPWYTIPTNGSGSYWNQPILPSWDPKQRSKYPSEVHKLPGDIASVFYPSLGAYSSANPSVIDQHMKWISSAGIDVVVVSWIPNQAVNSQGLFSPDWVIPRLLDAAAKVELKITLHLESYKSRSFLTIRDDISYILRNYGNHTSFYRYKNREVSSNSHSQSGKNTELPLFYINDPFTIPPAQWGALAGSNGSSTIRGTELDANLIGLYVDKDDGKRLLESGFDGLYTYFGADGFTYGSTAANWPEISIFCTQNQLLFVPSVSPGSNDTQIRPWNSANAHARKDGEYYREHFRIAHASKPDILSITSFNQWQDGTQIEPAKPFKAGINGTANAYKYSAYERSPEQYLEITLEMIKAYFTPHHQNIPAQIARIV